MILIETFYCLNRATFGSVLSVWQKEILIGIGDGLDDLRIVVAEANLFAFLLDFSVGLCLPVKKSILIFPFELLECML